MNALEAKQLLEQVPEEQWITGDFGRPDGRCCAIGHLVRLKIQPEEINNQTCSDYAGDAVFQIGNILYDQYREDIDEIHEFVRTKVETFIEETYGEYANLADVNNSPSVNDYTQESIKERVLACLDDMIEWEKDHE